METYFTRIRKKQSSRQNGAKLQNIPGQNSVRQKNLITADKVIPDKIVPIKCGNNYKHNIQTINKHNL